MSERPTLKFEVPGPDYRGDSDMQVLWQKTGALIDVARLHMTDEAVFSVLLSRICRELRRHHGTPFAKEMLAGFIATMEEAEQYDMGTPALALSAAKETALRLVDAGHPVQAMAAFIADLLVREPWQKDQVATMERMRRGLDLAALGDPRLKAWIEAFE